jgi:hypothetical protein
MTVGDFFLGCEDPHALNVVEALRTVGVWSSGDVALGEPREKTWVLDPLLLRAGSNEIEFRYERGPHRLDIHRVDSCSRSQFEFRHFWP